MRLPYATLVAQATYDFKNLLAAANEMLGYSLAEGADRSIKKLTDAERFIACLKSLTERGAKPSFDGFLGHGFASVLVVLAECDVLPFVSTGVPAAVAKTVAPGVYCVIMSATLAQWKQAVVDGLSRVESRAAYGAVMQVFEAANYNLWADYAKKPAGQLFLLKGK